ncbi:hypothetical protein GCM10018785_32920 [Streptomyces longispororuber]|uniref:Uncharacterized protein n=1 Tax=Streptomyces longispororuber TaxID=68230 RepID=A0A918ZPX1_9ACTN|nr:hypothetical protein GCM10018785_32920 [Streptomyces longispororuber]
MVRCRGVAGVWVCGVAGVPGGGLSDIFDGPVLCGGWLGADCGAGQGLVTGGLVLTVFRVDVRF